MQLREDAPFDKATWERSRENPPTFCPRCGRPLERGGWTTVDQSRRYEYLCCFGGSWLAWWARRVKITEPHSAHYLYNLGSRSSIDGSAERFDKFTGKPLA